MRRSWANLYNGPAAFTATALVFHLPLYAWAIWLVTYVPVFIVMRRGMVRGSGVPMVLGLPRRERRDLYRRLYEGEEIPAHLKPYARDIVAQQRRTGFQGPAGLIGLGALLLGMVLIAHDAETPHRYPHHGLLACMAVGTLVYGVVLSIRFQRIVSRTDL